MSLPIEVSTDTTIRLYTKMNLTGSNVVEAYEREPQPTDQHTTYCRGAIEQPGYYTGQWYDATDKYRKVHSKPTTKVAKTPEELIAEAEALLSKLRGE